MERGLERSRKQEVNQGLWYSFGGYDFREKQSQDVGRVKWEKVRNIQQV